MNSTIVIIDKYENPIQKVENFILFGTMLRIYFKDESRSPMYGKFVALKDHKDLVVKGMVRFVPNSRLHMFNDTDNEHRRSTSTSVMTLSNFKMFKPDSICQ